jgi:adenylate/nucleoside-diphosphate kinase
VAFVKEALGDELVKDISCNGSVRDVLIRIRNEIDPFYLKIDNVDDIRTSADLGEDDKKLPLGDFGEYCPVTYVKENWLVRGNPEFEVIINGKSYFLAGEKEAEEFKFNPTDFLITQNGMCNLPLLPPPPKIMVVG